MAVLSTHHTPLLAADVPSSATTFQRPSKQLIKYQLIAVKSSRGLGGADTYDVYPDQDIESHDPRHGQVRKQSGTLAVKSVGDRHALLVKSLDDTQAKVAH